MALGASVTLFCNADHLLQSDCSDVIVVSAGRDAVDYELAKVCGAGDVVVTQDYRLAIMALSKCVHVLHWDGRQYTYDGSNILRGDKLMIRWTFQRQEAQK